MKSEVVATLSQQRIEIMEICEEQTPKTPVIVIINDERDQLFGLLQRRGLVVENIARKNFVETNSSLSVFTKKHGAGTLSSSSMTYKGEALTFTLRRR